MQALSCHVPSPLHVCVLVPQFPQATGFVWPAAQTPVQVPDTHVRFAAQAAVVPHVQLLPHVCIPLPEHWVAPGLHAQSLNELVGRPDELPDEVIVPEEESLDDPDEGVEEEPLDDPDDGAEEEPLDDPDDGAEEAPDELFDEALDESESAFPPSVCNDGFPIPRMASQPVLLMIPPAIRTTPGMKKPVVALRSPGARLSVFTAAGVGQFLPESGPAELFLRRRPRLAQR
jgi:hypothetical protein